MQWTDSDLAQYVNLCDEPTVLGRQLMEIVRHGNTATPLEDQAPEMTVTMEVELLIRAHFCYVLVCSMDGIDSVLKLAQERVPRYVEKHEYRALVRLLTGIKKFREMEFVLDILMAKDKFELIMSKRVLANDPDGQLELKMALRDYLVRRHPVCWRWAFFFSKLDGIFVGCVTCDLLTSPLPPLSIYSNQQEKEEVLQMVFLHFSMFREIGINRLQNATQQIRRLGRQPPGHARSKDLLFIIQMLSEAAQSLMKEDCPRLARQCLTLARLVGLQLQMVDVALLNLSRSAVTQFLQRHPDFRESLVVATAYDRDSMSEWILPIYEQVIKNGNFRYLDHMHENLSLPRSVYSDVVRTHVRDSQSGQHAANLKEFIEYCPDQVTRFALFREAGLHGEARGLVKQSLYLRDADQAGKLA